MPKETSPAAPAAMESGPLMIALVYVETEEYICRRREVVGILMRVLRRLDKRRESCEMAIVR